MVHAIDHKNEEFNGQGTEMNQRYASAAVQVDPTAQPEELPADGLRLAPSTRPGAKVPHAWRVDTRGHKVSTLDLTGHGMFSVVTGIAGTAWALAVEKLQLEYLRQVVIGQVGAVDAYADWFRLREVYEAGALLVRPDGYVAWRHPGAEDAGRAVTLLREALAQVLAIDMA